MVGNMGKYFTFFILFSFIFELFGETAILDFKTKNKTNLKERTEMLDLVRMNLKKKFDIDTVFVVNLFNVSGEYAWFKGDATRTDGKSILLPEDQGLDCCHVESFFIKKNGKWKILASQSFSTDVWWEELPKKYPKANTLLFKEP